MTTQIKESKSRIKMRSCQILLNQMQECIVIPPHTSCTPMIKVWLDKVFAKIYSLILQYT